MAHIQSINYTSPHVHAKMRKEVGNWCYPVIGKIRKGWYRPYHSELYFDDWRIPEVLLDQFASDFRFEDPSVFLGRTESRGKLIKFLVKFIRKLGPWENRKFESKKDMYRFRSWKYSLLLGTVKDPLQKIPHHNDYKEVL